MKVLHKHNVYLDKVQSGIYINAMQADAYTRILEFSLYSGGVAWKVPQGVSVAVAYGGASGHGVYDTLPDGSPACTVSGNVVTAVVVPQAVSMYGNTNLTIIFTDGNGKQLTAFCVTLKVERNPAVGAAKLPSYINMRQWLTDELSKMLLDFNIIVFPAGDGYITEETMEDIQAAFKAGRAMRCVLETDSQELLYLPLAKIQLDTYHFAAVVDGLEYRVEISADGVVVEVTSLGSGANDSGSSQNANCLLTVETITIGESGEPESIPVTSITLDYSTISLDVGDSMMLAASVTPSNATNNAVLWESSDTSIALVDNGYVTAVSEGNAVITAKSAENNSIKATCSAAVAAESGGETDETKVQLVSLDYAPNTLKNKNGNTATVTKGNYVEIPYSDGMQISTGLNNGWTGNYPPFMVEDNGIISVPEYAQGAMITSPFYLFTCVLTGFSETAKVYVNFAWDMTAADAVDSVIATDSYYYIPGGAN